MSGAAVQGRIKGISCAILAGGKSSRFPIQKPLMMIEGEPVIRLQLRLMSGLFDEVLISTNSPELYFSLGYPMLGDILQSVGPMAGIHTALKAASNNHIFITACDMPYPNPELVKRLCACHLANAGKDATIPVFGGRPQPLFGLYSKTVLPVMEDAIINSRTAMIRFLDEITVNFAEAEVREVDPEGRSFLNINTIEDYEALTGSSCEGCAEA